MKLTVSPHEMPNAHMHARLNRACIRCDSVYLARPDASTRDRFAHASGPHSPVGLSPTDLEHGPDPTLPLLEQGIAISRALECATRSCDAMIVNLTPFGSPSADVGSASRLAGFERFEHASIRLRR